MSSNLTWSLPLTNPLPGELAFLSTNGLGALSWTAPPGVFGLEALKTAVQAHGGAAGTTVAVSWQGSTTFGGALYIDIGVGANDTKITTLFDGRIHVHAVLGVTQDGLASTTMLGRYRVNGGATVLLGTSRGYSAGAVFGNMSVVWDFELDVSENDYIELLTVVESTSQVSSMNSIVAESFVVARRIM
jgi:hypothetical protein